MNATLDNLTTDTRSDTSEFSKSSDSPNKIGRYPRTWSTVYDAVKGNIAAMSMMAPSYMELIMTSDCNLRCSYCFEKDKVPVNMSEETALASVDFLISASRDVKDLTILYFGGEPMMRFDLMQVIHDYTSKAVQKAGKTISWSMTTNGTLIDESRAKWLAANDIKYLLSMDGGQEDHNRYRHFPDGTGTYDLMKERMSMWKKHQPWIGVKMSIAPESCLRLRQNLEELSDIGINQFIIGYAHGLEWTDQSLIEFEQGMLDVCELYLEKKWNKEYFRITTFEEDSLCDIKPIPFGCGAGRGRFCIDPLGDIYGCSKLCTIMGPGKGVYPLGNVFQGYTQIDNRQLFLGESVSRRIRCGNCEFNKICGGGCPATNAADTGNVFLPGDVECKLGLIYRRVNEYMRRRHDEVFGTSWTEKAQNDEMQIFSSC